MREIFGENLRRIRGEKALTQEQLAECIGVTAQAVSKWECAQSWPDTDSLVALADRLEVPLDALLRQRGVGQARLDALPEDGVLRVVQCRGRTVLTCETYDPAKKTPLLIRREDYEGNGAPLIRMEIWGSADIEGCVNGGVHAGDSVNCGNVSGGVSAGDGVNCGNVDGGVIAGDSVNCGNVGGGVIAGDGVNCGNVEGNIESCGGDIHCGEVGGDILRCEGMVYVGKDG